MLAVLLSVSSLALESYRPGFLQEMPARGSRRGQAFPVPGLMNIGLSD